MLDTLRKPFFVAAGLSITVVVLIEVGCAVLASLGRETPGLGIPYLSFIDGQLLYAIVLMAISLLIPRRVHGDLQGIVSLIVGVVVLVVALYKAIAAFVALMVMVSLLLAPIFGTIAYLVLFGTFPKTAAGVTLTTLMTAKLFFAGFLLAAHQRFLQNKGLVLLSLLSFVANLALSFLHAWVPGMLVSISDAIGAVIIAIIAAVWAFLTIIGGIIAIVKAIV